MKYARNPCTATVILSTYFIYNNATIAIRLCAIYRPGPAGQYDGLFPNAHLHAVRRFRQVGKGWFPADSQTALRATSAPGRRSQGLPTVLIVLPVTRRRIDNLEHESARRLKTADLFEQSPDGSTWASARSFMNIIPYAGSVRRS